ncbi:hypothetical protein CEXT_191231 [Caerostris extrusa]|uniref:Uncharacterized protein n=1 Tax=Caerostris extrusa TaxID=172846 RepID=A0AAV4N6L4_CAEEX|nr:hypothetical protein CEXT_191231 [Caerostris extrusa]
MPRFKRGSLRLKPKTVIRCVDVVLVMAYSTQHAPCITHIHKCKNPICKGDIQTVWVLWLSLKTFEDVIWMLGWEKMADVNGQGQTFG